MMQQVVLCDADNTLWDTDSVYAKAQEALLSRVEAILDIRNLAHGRLDFVRRYDQALAAKHHLHFRYPPIMLVFGLADGLRGGSPDVAARAALTGHRNSDAISIPLAEQIVADYVGARDKTPGLLPGVEEGLKLAQRRGLGVYMLTEGRIEKQRKIIEIHGLGWAFESVLEVTKTVTQFRRLRERFASASVTVIGDQPDRDIEPALSAGCSAVLIPSRFRPAWHISDSWESATYVASDFSDAIAWITKMPAAI
ncbi:putative hydrolase of the HAD superfamily [Caballeronia udeis]|uniref:Hydrolase of the HAD superfamily n=1 Tax=Caballeronia udeis TaxID=1232866 RepID=A0ABW8MY85_9BURK